MEDEEIIQLFNARSERAIPELDIKYGKLCRSVSNGILHCYEDVEECVNDTYLGVWNKIPPERPNPLIAFVCRIVRNISIAKHKYNTAKKRNSVYDVCLDELEECISSSSNTEEQFDNSLLSGFIDEFLDTLDLTNRVIFVQRYWFFSEFGSIAAQTGLSEGNIRVRISRTRKKLKEYLKSKGVQL